MPAVLIKRLEAGAIGIKLTDSLLMLPTKSVTAVMGVSRKPHRCDVRGCEACGKVDRMQEVGAGLPGASGNERE